ncbi:MAG: winged helix-turn-helix domain-containing protein [Saprospiraceae bacterium]
MRMIGHEILKCWGDGESRIMPIEKIDGQYKISFEFEFGFDPDEIVAIIDRIITETRIASDYLVEVAQCETKAVVYSFEIRNAYPDMIPCGGRILPEDCYHLLITITDDVSLSLPNRQAIANSQAIIADSSSMEALSTAGSSLTASESKGSTLLKFAFFIIPLLFLIGFIGYFIKKKNLADIDPNLILIGAFQFDKRNMMLYFENEKIELSNKEAELLALLHAEANEPIAREVILQSVWGDEGNYVGRTLDVFISKLRKKLEADTSVKIVNIRGIGYKLVIA